MIGRKSLLARIAAMEARIRAALPSWTDDRDSFIEALDVDSQKYQVKNPDGSTGYDFMRALSDTAAEDWKDYGEEENDYAELPG